MFPLPPPPPTPIYAHYRFPPNRLNALAAYTMTVLAALTFACFLSTFLLVDYGARADIGTVNVVVKHVSDYSASREKNDLGFLTFDLQADLNPLFNWNVKQLFLYLTAEYATPKNAVNQARRNGIS